MEETDWAVWQATADPYLCRRDSNTVLAQSLWGLCVLVHTRFVWAPQGLWRVKGLILNMILPLLLSCWGFSFALGSGVSLFVGIQHSPIDSFSAVSCNFGILTGEDEHMSFHFAILKTCRLIIPWGNIFHWYCFMGACWLILGTKNANFSLSCGAKVIV